MAKLNGWKKEATKGSDKFLCVLELVWSAGEEGLHNTCYPGDDRIVKAHARDSLDGTKYNAVSPETRAFAVR